MDTADTFGSEGGDAMSIDPAVQHGVEGGQRTGCDVRTWSFGWGRVSLGEDPPALSEAEAAHIHASLWHPQVGIPTLGLMGSLPPGGQLNELLSLPLQPL